MGRLTARRRVSMDDLRDLFDLSTKMIRKRRVDTAAARRHPSGGSAYRAEDPSAPASAPVEDAEPRRVARVVGPAAAWRSEAATNRGRRDA